VGSPCNVGTPKAGTLSINYDAASGGAVSMVCAPGVAFTLSVSTLGTGVGTVTGSGLSCPGVCDKAFPSGSAVTLTAAAGGVDVFTGWTGACSGTATTCTVTLGAAMSVGATFAAYRTLTLTVSSTFHHEVCTTQPITGTHCDPAYFSDGTVHSPLMCPCGFFGGGTVADITCSSPTNSSNPVSCSRAFPLGTVVSLEGTPTDTTGCDTGTACQVTMSTAKTVVARF
jgi:hypothetical protein